MTYRMALPLLVLLAAGGCSERAVTDPPMSLDSRSVGEAGSRLATSSARSGALNVKKDCSTYTGQAGESCTITESNVKAIEVGSTITYAQGATADGMLSTDVVLDPPGPGNNAAFGHCTLSLVTGVGECTFSGGTGKFTWFNARVDVSPLGWPNFAWDGEYSFGNAGNN
jgi:hypothetical protein